MPEGASCVLEAGCFLHRGAMICQNTDRSSCNTPKQLYLPHRTGQPDITPPDSPITLSASKPGAAPQSPWQHRTPPGSTPKPPGSTPKPPCCRNPAPSPASPPLRRRLRVPAAVCRRWSGDATCRARGSAGNGALKPPIFVHAYIYIYKSICIYIHIYIISIFYKSE